MPIMKRTMRNAAGGAIFGFVFLFMFLATAAAVDPNASIPSNRALRVAVIGSGIGGASTAYYLRQHFPNATISVFEQSDSVSGGRIRSFEWQGRIYEAGAEVFTTFNYLLYKLTTRELGIQLHGEEQQQQQRQNDRSDTSPTTSTSSLTEEEADEDPDDDKNIFIYDGKDQNLREWPFTQRSSLWKTLRVMALAHRFKLDLLRNYLARVDRPNEVFRTLDEFAVGSCGGCSSSSSCQSPDGFADESPCFNLRHYLTRSISEFLEERGMSREWIQSAVAPMTRVIYDQNEEINGFAGLVSLVSADDTRAAKQGNAYMVQRLLNASFATLHLNTPVRVLRYSKSNTSDSRWNWDVEGHLFDVVVVATPFPISGGLKCERMTGVGQDQQQPATIHDDDDNHDPTGCGVGPVGDRVSKVVTYVSATGLNKAYFGKFADQATNVFTTPLSDVNNVPFLSIGLKYKSPSNGTALYKVFSPKPLSTKQLELIFNSPRVVVAQAWPGVFSRLPPLNFSQSPRIAGREGLYYLSAIESVTVAMEGSIISAHNIARLVRVDYGGSSSSSSSSSPFTEQRNSPNSETIASETNTVVRWASWVVSSPFTEQMAQSFVVGWLITYSGFGSLNPSSPTHILVYCFIHLVSLLPRHLWGLPMRNAVGVEWISTELTAGAIAGLGLYLLRSCSVLHALVQYSQSRESLPAVLGGVITFVFLWIPIGLSSSVREATDVIALALRSLTGDKAWCGLGVSPSLMIASSACSFLPPLPLLLPLLIAPIVIFAIKNRKSESLFGREWSRWMSIVLGAALPVSLLLLEAARYGGPPITLSAGLAWADPMSVPESIWRWVVSSAVLMIGAAACSLVTGRKNLSPASSSSSTSNLPFHQTASNPISVFVGCWLISVALSISSGFSPSFTLAQMSVQLLLFTLFSPPWA